MNVGVWQNFQINRRNIGKEAKLKKLDIVSSIKKIMAVGKKIKANYFISSSVCVIERRLRDAIDPCRGR